ncbi:pseudaminic acid synthase [Selenomonas ruminantium]|uniref:N-acetylneuraminate synthase/pseudaminic acid synthase n=1 Tax=Selenomonas ruminantium TaxID=971 RepID=A0A1I0XXE0_SELRU|nr:pseudaminic acid synthase [Selenomonas ruminantium]SFB05671.1 N-acetylneuraminate synthase/pseudaminic acid synthase [Selenomonas ruminantium]
MSRTIKIGNKIVGENHPAYLIAEMSANHLQDYDRAKKIIFEAKNAGADAIKLQSYRPDTITIDCYGDNFMATKGSIWEGKNLYQLYQSAYMPWEWHEGLFEYAHDIGIEIFSSPFDLSAVDLLESLNVSAYKIASYEILDIPLIKKCARTGKPIILSTGIATLTDVERAIDVCKAEGNKNIAVLKCVSQYPTQYCNLNLRTIPHMADTFDCVVGLSDHSMGDAVDVAAVSLGANIIEKHLTISRSDGGADSIFSMEPKEFSKMVTDVRNVEQALGKISYELTDVQKRSRKNARSLYVVEHVRKGEVFTPHNLKSIRPGGGIETWYYDEILGKKASIDITRGTAMKWEYVDK